MSYARWSNSDLYVFWTVVGTLKALECCGCSLMPTEDEVFHENFYAFNTRDFVAHVEAHVEAGDDVPDHMIDELWVDDIRNFS